MQIIEYLANRWFITVTRAVTISPATGTIVWLPSVLTSTIFDWKIIRIQWIAYELCVWIERTVDLPCLFEKCWQHRPIVNRYILAVRMSLPQTLCSHPISRAVVREHKSNHPSSRFHPYFLQKMFSFCKQATMKRIAFKTFTFWGYGHCSGSHMQYCQMFWKWHFTHKETISVNFVLQLRYFVYMQLLWIFVIEFDLKIIFQFIQINGK